nr:uncharacterized protein CTRU02_12885 [Colletotrichum truncatum]KAF6784118.1 hypothetical protein CTRU02_12885 [Colletotrichum truncatum]
MPDNFGDEGLSTGAKAGIGIGVSLGVIALGAAAYFHRRQARKANFWSAESIVTSLSLSDLMGSRGVFLPSPE